MNSRAAERGFSLVELLVAVVITLIVTGAIYGLIASSQTAFRKEPEAADRQQNIRIAMDLITRDVLIAGQGLPWFAQPFTVADATCNGNLNGCGPAGMMGPAAAAARGAGGDVEATDVLEVLAVEEQCPLYSVCEPTGGPIDAPGVIAVHDAVNANPGGCGAAPSLYVATNNFNFAIVAATAVAAPGGPCAPPSGAFNNAGFVAPWASQPGPNPQPLDLIGGTAAAWLAQARIARYTLAPDPVDGAMSLWRSTTGVYDTSGAPVGGPAAGAGTWQLVARGIEDFQVEYMAGNGVWANSPTLVSCPNQPQPPAGCLPADLATLTRQVRITLSSRSMAANLQGETLPGNGNVNQTALRGQLQSVVAPRTARLALQSQLLADGGIP